MLPSKATSVLFESQSKTLATNPELVSGVESGLCLLELRLVLGRGWARTAGAETETKFRALVIIVAIKD